jgi:hypothetical protein
LKNVNFKEGELKMKKLLVLLMVLGLATSAQAALSLSLSATQINVGDSVTVSVSDSVGVNWTWQFVLSEDTYNWTDPAAAAYNPNRSSGVGGGVTILAAAGGMASVTPDASYAAVTQLNAGGVTPAAPAAGVQFTVSIKGMQAGTIYIDLQDFEMDSKVGGYSTLVVVPEPMTLALLGLGGLFLRRRK